MMSKRIRKFKSNRVCCVPRCSNHAVSTLNTRISLHSFPSDAAIKEEWCVRLCICRPVTASMTVCSAHFVPSDFFWGNIELDVWQPHRRRLKKNAVPTQCLPLGTQVKKGSRLGASLQGQGNENGNTVEHALPDGFVAALVTASQEDKVAGVHHQYGTQESVREGLKEKKIQVQINGDGGALECVLPDGNGTAADMASQEDKVAADHHQQRTRKSARRGLKKKNIQSQINGDGGTLEFGLPGGGCAAADAVSQEDKVTELRHRLKTTGSTRKGVKKKIIQVQRDRGGGTSECVVPDGSVAADVIASQEDNVAAVRRQHKAKQSRRKGLKKKNIEPNSKCPVAARRSGHLAERRKNLNRQAGAVARNCHKQAASNARTAAKQIRKFRTRRRVRCKTKAVQACIMDPSVGVQASLPTVQHSFVQTDHRRLLLVERVA